MASLSSPPRNRDNSVAWPTGLMQLFFFCVAGAVVAGAVTIWLSHTDVSHAVPIFWITSATQLFFSLLVVTRFQRQQVVIPFVAVVSSAIVFRLIGILGLPLFEDDFYRYLFDGFMTATTGDPYSLAPAAFFTDHTVPATVEDILSQINYPDIATVYGPVSQWIFAASWSISPGDIWPFKLLAAVADIATLICLARLCQTGLQRNYLLLYAWSPLLIKEFAITAHPDIYAIAFSIAAICLLKANRFLLCGFLVALAVGAKVFAVLLLPLLVCYPGQFRHSFAIGAGFAAGIVLITLSFGSLTIWFPEGLGAMAKYWIFNAPVYSALLPFVDFSVLKLLALALLSICVAWRMLALWNARNNEMQDRKLYQGYLWIFATLLLCLPALNPWYVAWLLPFAVLLPSRWPFIWSLLALLAYFTGFNTGAGELHSVPTVLLCVQAAGIAIAVLIDWRYPPGRTEPVKQGD